MGNQTIVASQHAGFWSTATPITYDRNLLKSKKASRKKHSQIMVWHKDHINGFEAYYGKKSTGVRGGKDFRNSPCQIVTLQNSEYITGVGGTQTEAIDELIFYTNKGNVFKTGVNKGGQSFTLYQGSDNFIAYFSIGMADYLTYIKVDFRFHSIGFGKYTAPFVHISPAVHRHRGAYPPAGLGMGPAQAVAGATVASQNFARAPTASAVSSRPQTAQISMGKRLNTERDSAPLPAKMFDPSINKEREVQSEISDSDEESKYDNLDDDMVSLKN